MPIKLVRAIDLFRRDVRVNNKQSIGALCPIDLTEMRRSPRRCEVRDSNPAPVNITMPIRKDE
jgi:hypothetical protein